MEHTPFLKKIAACQSVSEIVKLNGFGRPQKMCAKKFAFLLKFYGIDFFRIAIIYIIFDFNNKKTFFKINDIKSKIYLNQFLWLIIIFFYYFNNLPFFIFHFHIIYS